MKKGKSPAIQTPTVPRNCKIQDSDCQAICSLMASRKLNESECCAILGIKRQRWYDWKTKQANKDRFAETFERMRALNIQACLDRIDACGDGKGMKQPDWRAKAWLVERLAPDRFYLQPEQSKGQVVVNILPDDSMAKIEAMMARHVSLDVSAPLKALENKGNNE